MFTYPLVQRPSLGRSARGGALALWKNFPLFYSLAYKPVLFEPVNVTAFPRVADGGGQPRHGGLATDLLSKSWTASQLWVREIRLKIGRKKLACCETVQRA